MSISESLLSELRRIHAKPPVQGSVGKSASSFLRELPRSVPRPSLSFDSPLDRGAVRDICIDPTVDALAAYAIAMAWGGQRMNYFRSSIRSSALPALLMSLRNSREAQAADYARARSAA